MFAFFLVCQPLSAQDAWKPVTNKNGIKTYTRSMTGSKIQEVRAVTVFDARMEELTEVLTDFSAFDQWMPSCAGARVLEGANHLDMTIYELNDLPWPVSDRDVVINVKTAFYMDKARAIVSMKNVETPTVALKNGVVRIHDFSGEYVFEYITREKTGVIYTYRVDIGGNVPAFIINFFNKRYLYDTFTGLRKMVKKEKYIQQAKKSGVVKRWNKVMKDDSQAKNIFKARMEEFIKNREFVDMLTVENDKYPIDYRSPLVGQVLLYAWSSKDDKKLAVRKLLEIMLENTDADKKTITRAAADKNLIAMILNGPGKTDRSVKSIIDSYVRAR